MFIKVINVKVLIFYPYGIERFAQNIVQNSTYDIRHSAKYRTQMVFMSGYMISLRSRDKMCAGSVKDEYLFMDLV